MILEMYTITEDGQKGALAGEASNIGKSVRFKPITYKNSDVGKTFFYRIEETKKDGFLCDTEPVDIKVTVTQNEMGLLKTVTYTKGGVQVRKHSYNSSLENKGVISISKTVEGNGAISRNILVCYGNISRREEIPAESMMLCLKIRKIWNQVRKRQYSKCDSEKNPV